MCIHQVATSLVTSPALLCFSTRPSAAFFTTILLLLTLHFDESMHTNIYFLVYLLHPRLFPSLPTYIHYCSEPPPHVLSPASETVLPRHSRPPTPPTAGVTPSLFDERHKTPRNLPLPLLAAARGNLSRTKRRKPRLAIQGEARAWTPALLSSTSLDLDPTASTPHHPAPPSPPHPPPPPPRPPSLPGCGRCPRGRKR